MNALKLNYLERNTKIGYTTVFLYKRIEIAKRYSKILAIIKNILFINSGNN